MTRRPEEIRIRVEQPDDYRGMEELTQEAFWNHFVPGCAEHYLLHEMRGKEAFVPQLSMIAQVDGKPAEHIVYAETAVRQDNGERKITEKSPSRRPLCHKGRRLRGQRLFPFLILTFGPDFCL